MGHWGQARPGVAKGRSRWTDVLTVLATVAALLGPVSAEATAQPVDPHTIWSPPDTPLPKTPSVAGHDLAPPAHTAPDRPVPAAWAGPPAAAAAATGTTTLDLPAAAAGRPQPARAAKLAVWVRPGGAAAKGVAARAADAPAAPAAAGTPVTVDVVPAATAAAAGYRGQVVALSRAAAGPAASVEVGVDVSGLDALYGADAAARSHLVAIPACALTTPQAPGCAASTPVPSHYDPATHRLVADVAVPATTAAATSASSAATSGLVLAPAISPAGGGGSYAATSLSPSAAWTAGSANGGFGYSYPIEVPQAPGGDTPTVALSYDSSSVDGMTSSTNAQSSWIGDGWDYSPGYVERSFKSCNDDGIAHSSDMCWGGYNATLSLDGQSSQLVRDDTDHDLWRLQNDDGSKVEFLSGASNGTSTGEYVKVSTSSGSTYYFGLNHLPGGDGTDPATDSAWTEPVYSPKSTDPCYDAAKGDASWCQTAWRLNLDYAVDSHGNLTTYSYAPESNYYQRGAGQNNGTGTLTSYVRDGALTSIAYGVRLPDQVAAKGTLKTPARVVFTPAPYGRCSTAGGFTCDGATLGKDNAAHWPDVPYDQNCDKGSTTCKNYGESYWSNLRLQSITTQVLSAGAYKDVDTYALSQHFPEPNDGTKPSMWLDSVTRTGDDGAPKLSLPPVTFTPVELPNRVDGTDLVPAPAIFNRPRIQTITTETGEQVQVDYRLPDCSRISGRMPASAATDTMACYNVKWYPPGSVYGADPVSDWFNRYQVDSVSQNDPVAHTRSITTSYDYGPAAWHHDDSELTDPKTRTWNDFRGYASVTAVTGGGEDGPPSQITTHYLQGMDGDDNGAGGHRSVTVKDTLGDSVTDSDWLSGQLYQTDTYDKAGGSVVAYDVSTSTASAPTATHARGSGLPDLTARFGGVRTVATSKARKKDGTWQSVATTTVSDPAHANRTLTVDRVADGQPEQCIRSSYATSSNTLITGLNDETLTVSGSSACTARPTAANTVADKRTLFDNKSFGQAGGTGNATSLQVLDHYDSSGNPVYATTGTSGYDLYGRTVSATDPNATDSAHPNGATTTTSYDSAHPGELASTVTVLSPAPGSSTDWKSVTTLDAARDLSLTSTDLNGKTTTAAYDSLGRLVKVWNPGRTSGQNPSIVYTYTVKGSDGPSAITTASLTSDAPHYNVSTDIFDGFGRQLQHQDTPGISAYHGRLLTTTVYDSQGRVRETQAARYDDSAPPGTTPSLADDDHVAGETSTDYDGLGRAVDSVFSSFAVEQWRTTTAYPGIDETDVTPPKGGTPTSTLTDSLGQTTQLWQYRTATATGKASDADVTAYTYTADGSQASQTDATTKNTWTHTFDLRGRQISATDPDTGKASSTYDADSRVASVTDARGITLTYDYDLIGRKTAEYSTTPPGTAKVQLGAWTYDTIDGAKGEPVSSTRYLNGDTGKPYTSTATGYDSGYRATGTTVSLPSSEGALAGPFTTTSTYNQINGTLTSSRTDARGNLPAETVTYSYDTNGALLGFGSTASVYDLSTDYDAFGRPVRTTVNPWGTEVVATDNYDQATGSLLSSYLDKQTAGTGAVQQTTYTHNAAGQTTAIQNIADNTPSQTDLQCFGYDYLGRLTTAWTDTGGLTTQPQPSVPGVGGCKNSTPTSGAAAGATTVGGPAPYWTSYGYDTVGNRKQLVQHDITGDTAKDVTTTQVFAPAGQRNTPSTAQSTGGGTGGPHALMSTTSTGPGSPGATSYQYDALGDTTAVSGTAGTTSMTWNAEDKLDSVTTAGTVGSTTYVYDADGNQLLRRNPGKTTLNLGGDELTLDTATGAVTDVRTYALPNGLSAVRQATGTAGLTWQLSDNHGTATLSLDAASLTETRRPVDPFGNTRGTKPASWAGDHGFVGGTQDPVTGLTNLGAREYQTSTGRFLNPDPVMDGTRPQQWNAYAYADNNPVNLADPAGTDPAGTQNSCQYDQSECGPHPGGGKSDPPRCNGRPPCASNPAGDAGTGSSGSGSGGKSKPKKVGGFTIGTAQDGQPTLDGIRLPTVTELYRMDPYAPNRNYGQILEDWAHGKCDWDGDSAGVAQFCKHAREAGLLGDDSGIKLTWADLDPFGVIDTYNCIKHGKSCGSAAMDIGMDLLFQSESKEAAKVAERAAAKAAEDAAEGDGAKALEDFLKCSSNSFPGGTPVLMAAGGTKPISQVAAGDEVMATDPITGLTGPHKVTRVIRTLTDTDFTDLTVGSPGGPAVITSTQHHPYWDVTRHRWVDAADLHAGDRLRTADGATVQASRIRNYTGHIVTYNLTVDQVHTYYVQAGSAPVLVHNNSCPVFPNQMNDPEILAKELADAAAAGVSPLSVGSHAFQDAVSKGGTYLWAVGENGELRIISDVSDKIKHSVLFDGADVRGAGKVVFENGEVSMIDNESGHYWPFFTEEDTSQFLPSGADAFRNAGVNVPESAVTPFERDW
ncbi:RHS repeat-associated core domain-containing protein [Actinacidiphila bryophytorum]|uniref:RHS repeat-associated core domain-containing protein n=1 Tax=Actinacidiphila bryophytorum TaxID=1436133 RepID=UPI002176D8CC|nr:RHS repeat-associated core domain-containing protein [Actinacidiphila bryophytorum]UWE09085.1 polymorphic toxin-type HINT domain-containing protein [Actinacidiphila bryophytorum]